MPRETGKQRASGIPLDYFRHRNSLDRGKLILAAVVAAVTVAWLSAGSLSGRRAAAWYSPGRVTAAHAMWENDCSACHVNFTPIAGDAAAASLIGDKAAIDAKCQACHNVSSKSNSLGHHASKDPAMLACSSCHFEHRGRTESLVRIADASCTNCHADIAAHRERPSLLPQPMHNVSQFDAEHHPEFRSIATDQRNLKFNAAAHHLHLTPGLAVDEKHQAVMTVGMLSANDKPRYARPGQNDADLVQLSCGACHQLSGMELGAGTGRLRWPVAPSATVSPSAPVPPDKSEPPGVSMKSAGGAYMQPIVFENQCRACHPLTISPGQDSKSDMKVAADVVAHRLQPAQLATEVRRYWGDRYLHEHPTQLERGLPLPSHPRELENRDAREWIRDNAIGSLNHLRTVCSECHELSGVTAEKLSLGGEPAVLLPPTVLPVQVPHVWLEHAKFDHSAHRSVNCRDCHAGAYPSDAGVQAGPSTSAPMIPGRDTCVRCHGPREEASEPARGGARFDCVECHRFHNRDEP
jgi:Cytochrome c7 and related cytochrome c